MTLSPCLQSGRFLRSVFGVLHVAEVILAFGDVSKEWNSSLIISFYLALLGVLVQVREEVFRKFESNSEENEEWIENLGVQSLMREFRQ